MTVFNKVAHKIGLLLITFLVVSGCGDNSKKSAAEDVSFDQADKKIIASLDKVLKELPPPTEVPYLLQATGADYDQSLVNDYTKADSYLTNENKAALNLGIYATDMGYVTSYDQSQMSMKYLEACQKLSEAIGVASVFNLSILEKFQANINNSDTVNVLLSKSIVEAEQRLEQSDRIEVAALILTGSFLEGVYLATRVVETYPTDILDEQNRNLILEPMVRVVLDQKKPLLDIIKMLKTLPTSDAVASMIADLNILRVLYEGDLTEIENKIANNTGNFVLTQDMLIDVTTEVKSIRDKIISN